MRPRRCERAWRTLRAIALVLLIAGPVWTAAVAGDPSVLGMRMFDASSHTRVVFDLSASVEYNLFSLRKPDRVVLDFRGVRFKTELKNGFRQNRRISGIRQAKRGNDRYRVVFEMVRQERARSFLLSPHGRRGHRLVVDFGRAENTAAKAGRVTPVPGASKPEPTGRLRDVVVAIDAGHGGKDPGAIGRRRKTREKDVTLSIARLLAAELRQRPGIRPVLVRDGDYFIPLRRRTAIAREAGADLFVSIHADAFKNPKVRGASAYVLSWRGASSEAARWLAERENAADRAGGFDLGEHEPMVRSAMVDMSRNGRGTAERRPRAPGAARAEEKGPGTCQACPPGRVRGPQDEEHPFGADRDRISLQSDRREAAARQALPAPDRARDRGRDRSLLPAPGAGGDPARGAQPLQAGVELVSCHSSDIG